MRIPMRRKIQLTLTHPYESKAKLKNNFKNTSQQYAWVNTSCGCVTQCDSATDFITKFKKIFLLLNQLLCDLFRNENISD